jgi:hypothetical protein
MSLGGAPLGDYDADVKGWWSWLAGEADPAIDTLQTVFDATQNIATPQVTAFTSLATTALTDPATSAGKVTTQADNFASRIAALGDVYFGDAATSVVSDYDSIINPTSRVTAATAAHEARSRTDLLRAQARLNASMAEINATSSSALYIGDALLEIDHARNVEGFQSKLEWQEEMIRIASIMQGTLAALSYQSSQLASYGSLVDVTRGAYTMNIDSERQYVDDKIRIGADAILWDLNMFAYAYPGINTIAGAGVIPKGPSSIGGLLSGAMSGAAMGAPMGPAGMIMGGAFGAAAGYLSTPGLVF